ncbi:hypothetical protein PQS31_00675 [Luteimonas sp BLCC-B24]|uniref:DUF6116 family protein n=1 Tax=Luteimonas sp. BLCC-B24 TaxID=3025317 RepID=UPI00234C8AFF|nr:DUF6116 family protein [Luteimonas sp. BLCC-B24]MDC7805342.1 hypothetical protein [Luteimonas sp. BLCC-B24]
MRSIFSAPLIAWLSRLSYPRLFLVVAALFGINLLIPDPIILVDEVLLGLATVMLAKRKRAPKPGTAPPRPPIDGEARRS